MKKYRTERRNGVRTVSAFGVFGSSEALREEECRVVEEAVLTIDVEGVGTYLLMWTPTDAVDIAMGYTRAEGVLAESANPEALALALGFCFTEGVIGAIDDIRAIALCPDAPGVVRVQLVDPARGKPRRRHAVVKSSCGVCGDRESIEDGIPELSPVPDTLRWKAEQFERLMATMRESQAIFLHTGGTHAAAVFSPEGRILALAEDLGRHNALDKVIGICMLRAQSLDACGVLLSSRLSCEMVVKAARAKFELVAAVSAPTSLAIEVANRCGITLCGFVREKRATVYTHPHRLGGIEPPLVPVEIADRL